MKQYTSNWKWAADCLPASRNPTPAHHSRCAEVLFCNCIQGNVDSETAPAFLAAQGRTTMHTLFKHADLKDASVSRKRLNTTGKLHIAITKAGHRNKPEFWVVNSLLSGFIQMLCRYTLLPFILLNPNLTLRFFFAVHFKRHFGAIFPVSSVFGGIPCMLYMFYENNSYIPMPTNMLRQGGPERVKWMLQPAREANTGRIPRPGAMLTAW